MDVNELSRNQSHISKSYIDNSIDIKGDLNFVDTLEIQGSVNGNITSNSDSITFLIIGQNANIYGNITSSHVVVMGSVTGNIYAKHAIIEDTAKIKGILYYNSIEVHYGAQIDGAMKINRKYEKETSTSNNIQIANDKNYPNQKISNDSKASNVDTSHTGVIAF